jgi:glutathione synthase/RimK-type ligase-like ATP-grasp enzyme
MPATSPLRILVTYGWCRTAYVVAESLARAGYAVYGCDDSRWNMLRCSRHVRGTDVVSDPFRQPERFVTDIAAVVRKRGIDILLPVHEDALAIRRFGHLLPRGLMVIAPDLEDLLTAVDKLAIVAIAERAGVPAPRTYSPMTASEAGQAAAGIGGRSILKARRGNSGKGVRLVQSPAQMAGFWEDMVRRFDLPAAKGPIVQEFVEGDLYGSCFLASGGDVKAVFLEKYLRWKEGKLGTSVLREPASWPLLAELTRKIARELRWTGIGHLDFVGSREEDRACLLEMNPRFWGAINMAVRNGYDFPWGLVTLYIDGRPDPRAFIPGPAPVKSRWVLGDIISAFQKDGGSRAVSLISSLGRALVPGPGVVQDDLRWGDPLAIAAEAAQYLARFFRSGFSVNPVNKEMMR